MTFRRLGILMSLSLGILTLIGVSLAIAVHSDARCDAVASNDQPSLMSGGTDNYFPMDINRTWRYRWWNDVYEPGDIIDHITVVAHSDDRYSFYVVSTHPWSHYGWFSYTLESDGVHLSGASTEGGSHFPVPFYYAFHFLEPGSSKLLQHPITVGDQWTSITIGDNIPTTGTTTVTGYETVTVPGGTFQALCTTTVITTVGNPTKSGVRSMWFANDVGLVKLVWAHNDGSTTTVELEPSVPYWPRSERNPVLQPVPSTWENDWVVGATVLHDIVSDTYRMWYAGIADKSTDPNPRYRIGYAESNDGQLWSRSVLSPVLDTGDSGAWDEIAATLPSVVFQNGEYKMWYVGAGTSYSAAIGLATSPDGMSWTKSLSNPVLTNGAPGSWDSAGVRDPTVVFRDGLYRMWYANEWHSEGDPSYIGYATSLDGVNWAKHPGNPVLVPGPTGDWDHGGVFGPAVFYDEKLGKYEMWYVGYAGSEHATDRFGRAFSHDGITWVKDSRNPIMYPQSDYRDPLLQFNEANHWEAYSIQKPCVLLENGRRHIWFTGIGWIPGGFGAVGLAAQIGYAGEAYHTYLPLLSVAAQPVAGGDSAFGAE